MQNHDENTPGPATVSGSETMDRRRAFGKLLQASREKVGELQREFREATARLRAAIQEWQEAHRLVQAALA